MSRIWAALPLVTDPLEKPPVPPAACWWQHPLRKNEDGYELIVRTDTTSDYQAARLGCWEWFDGLDEQLILGVDVFDVRNCMDGARSHIDVLAVDVPTRSPAWRNLTDPEDQRWRHDCGFQVPASAFVRSPFATPPLVAQRRSESRNI